MIRISCAECQDIDLCLDCFSEGCSFGSHFPSHDYRVTEPLHFTIFCSEWRADEEILFIEGMQNNGIGNWEDVSEYVGSKSLEECRIHFLDIYARNRTAEIVLASSTDSLPKKKYKLPSDVKEDSEEILTSHPSDHEITGFMPKRLEFETEIENDAEQSIKDIIFNPDVDSKLEKEMKLALLDEYSGVLHRRNERKKFIIERGMIDFKQFQSEERNFLSKHSIIKSLYNGLKPIARFLSSHAEFYYLLEGLAKEEEIRTRLNLLHKYRKNGLKSLNDVSDFERDLKIRALSITSDNSNVYRKEYVSVPTRSSSGLAHNAPFTNNSSNRKPGTPLDLSSAEGLDLLTPSERELCSILRLMPRVYLGIKESLLREYMRVGYLKRASARNLVRIDVNKTSRIYDFFVAAGWVKPE